MTRKFQYSDELYAALAPVILAIREVVPDLKVYEADYGWGVLVYSPLLGKQMPLAIPGFETKGKVIEGWTIFDFAATRGLTDEQSLKELVETWRALTPISKPEER